jgi:hypothetical protein
MLIIVLDLLVACQARESLSGSRRLTVALSPGPPRLSPTSAISESPVFTASGERPQDDGGSEKTAPTNAGRFLGGEIKLILIGSAVVLALLGVAAYQWLAERVNEDDENPEYTRAIFGADAFEFSQMETL